MTRRWVKKELKKNPLEKAVISAIKFVRKNKNEVVVALGVVLLVSLFGIMIIRDRIRQDKEASRIFTAAQADFENFNYGASIEKLKQVTRDYPRTAIIDHAYYLKALAFMEEGENEKAHEVLMRLVVEHPNSGIINEIRIALAMSYEEEEEYERAAEVYGEIDEGSYLKAEALTGQARAYDSLDREEEAVDLYQRVKTSYPHTYWEEFADLRLREMGVEVEEEISPELEIR